MSATLRTSLPDNPSGVDHFKIFSHSGRGCSDNQLRKTRVLGRAYRSWRAMLLLSESTTAVCEEIDHGAFGSLGERRRGVRVRQNRPVKVYEPGAGRYFGGQTEDVSTTGLRIELPAWVPVRAGETLNIHVGLSRRGESLANRRQMIPARVVWVSRHAGKRPRVEAGVEFLSSIAAHLDAA